METPEHNGTDGESTEPGTEPQETAVEPGPPDTDQYYWKLQNYLRMVTSGETDALMIEAGPGIGKSYQISTTLTDEVGDSGYYKMSGYSTPVELYHSLYEVSDGKILFLDDLEGILSDDKALGLLKQATWSETEERHVEWRSTSNAIEVPEKFRFKGRIIMCFNEVPEDDDIFESLADRCLSYQISFSYAERLGIMREVAKEDYKGLSREERQDVVDWIEQYSTPADDVNLRLMYHVMDMRAFNPERWEELAVEQLETDPELVLVERLLNEHDTAKGAQEAFQEETGKSRRTFFRRKEQLDENTEGL